jgi:hypothetical protein
MLWAVVALFNAITKAKREEQENENNDDSKPGKAVR